MIGCDAPNASVQRAAMAEDVPSSWQENNRMKNTY